MKESRRKVWVEFSAGGIVYRTLAAGIEIAFIKDPYYQWTFPKGHVEEGEGIIAAAVRESEEEMGIKGLKPVAKLTSLEIWFVDRYVHKGDLVHKIIYLVLLRAPSHAKARPQKKEKIRAVRWVPLDQSLAFSGYANVKPALRKAIAILKRQYNHAPSHRSGNRHSRIGARKSSRVSHR